MKSKLAIILDNMSNYLSKRKGLLPLIGLSLIVLNLLFSLFMTNWFSQTNFLLHFGIIIAILGFMLAWAL